MRSTNQSIKLDEKASAWATALLLEFETICYQHGVSLQPPAIEVSDSQIGKWGLWDSRQNRLFIHYDLIAKYSWQVVVEVLKHEMAHMLTEQMGYLDNSNPHGEAFRAACERLGVEPWARAATVDPANFHHWRHQSEAKEQSPLMRKVKKLFALSQSANEQEAELALKQAKRLLIKHQLDTWEKGSDELEASIVRHHLPLGKKKVATHFYDILRLLSSHFGVQVIYSTGYDAEQCCSIKIAELVGTRTDLDFSIYVFEFLQETLHRLFTEHKRVTGVKGIRAKNSYYYGVLKSIGENLKSKPQTPEELNKTIDSNKVDSKSLILMDKLNKQKEIAIEKIVQSYYPRLTQLSRHKKIDQNSFNAGKEAGKNVSINRPIQTNTKQNLFLNS